MIGLFYEPQLANSTSSDDRAASQPYLGKYINLGHKNFFMRFKISDRVRFHWEGK